MKLTLPCCRSIAVAVLASLSLPVALAAPPDGKGSGKGGGGDDSGDGSTEIAARLRTTAPVNYIKTELRWAGTADPTGPESQYNDRQPDFRGVIVMSINKSGRAVGYVGLASGFWHGVVSDVNPDGSPSNLLVDLNDLFAESLADLNAEREDDPQWRIAYGRRINSAGMIACQLIPGTAPSSIDTRSAANAGVEPVDSLLAVAELETGTLTVVDWAFDPDLDIMEINEAGDLLVQGTWLPEWPNADYHYHFIYKRDSTGGYSLLDLPGVTMPRPVFNDSLQVAHGGESYPLYDLFRRDEISDGGLTYLDTVVWAGNRKRRNSESFLVRGLSSSDPTTGQPGAPYALLRTSSGFVGTFRVTETERQLIAPYSEAYPPYQLAAMSRAPYGQEEFPLVEDATGLYQIYQPDMLADPSLGAQSPRGARFSFTPEQIEPWTVGWIAISSPNGPIGAENHYAGYVAFCATTGGPYRGYVLTPQPW